MELQRVNAGFNPTGPRRATASHCRRSDSILPRRQPSCSSESAKEHETLPGVTHVGMVSSLPFSGQNSQSSFSIEGRDVPPGQSGPHGEIRIVSWEYFQTMQIPLKSGRGFTDTDRAGAEPVAVVDENLAKLYWPAGDAVGKRISRGGPNPMYRIVGIVGVVKHAKLDTESKGAYYFVLPQARAVRLNVMVRAGGDARGAGAGDARRIGGNRPRPAHVRCEDHGRAGIGLHAAAAAGGVAVRDTVFGRAAVGGSGNLRRAIADGAAANGGDRHPDGAGRAAGTGVGAGSSRRIVVSRDRLGNWGGGARWARQSC